MATLTHKTTLLLSPQDYELLLQESKARNRTIGELIRVAIKKVYAPASPGKRKKAWDRLFAAETPVGDWEAMEAEISRGRLAS